MLGGFFYLGIFQLNIQVAKGFEEENKRLNEELQQLKIKLISETP